MSFPAFSGLFAIFIAAAAAAPDEIPTCKNVFEIMVKTDNYKCKQEEETIHRGILKLHDNQVNEIIEMHMRPLQLS